MERYYTIEIATPFSRHDYIILDAHSKQYFNGGQIIGCQDCHRGHNQHCGFYSLGGNAYRITNKASHLNLDSYPIDNNRFGAIHQW